MNLLDLPDCMLEQIFEYLNYDEIARKRLISKRIDTLCSRLLNRGFAKMVKRHSSNLRRIKSLLPRRESERRNHPLARHADILTCIETRISMLSMTYTKYMDLKLCCFIPGKVIDEILDILRLIESTKTPLRAHEVLQELRDISSMAIEHFDERIAHLLKKSFLSSPKFAPDNVSSSLQGEEIIIPHPDLGIRLEGSYRCQDSVKNRLAIARIELRYVKTIRKLNRMIQMQNNQTRTLRNNAVQMWEMNSQITELKRRIEESDAKNREISANINQITYEAGTSPQTSTEKTTRNIKPRTATIILKRRITEPAATKTKDEIKKPKLIESE